MPRIAAKSQQPFGCHSSLRKWSASSTDQRRVRVSKGTPSRLSAMNSQDAELGEWSLLVAQAQMEGRHSA